MVRIAIAGGTGQVAREVIDALLATRKHEILVLSRSEPTAGNQSSEVLFRTVDYNDKDALVKALHGVHTVLSFIVVHKDPENKCQTKLIDAAISAAVKRFAPSEWAGSDLTGMSLHANKAGIRAYLKEVNRHEKVLEYTLFQPGLFLDYLAAPYQTATHVAPLQTPFNFQHRCAIVVADHDPIITFTSVRDLAAIVARAVEYDGEWPTDGGISGNKIAVSELVVLGEKVRGNAFNLDKVPVGDLEAGKLSVSWLPTEGHQSFAGEEATRIIKAAYIGILLNGVSGGWNVGEDFNQIFVNHEFEPIAGFVERAWQDRP